MATKTDIELQIVDSVDTSHTDEEVLADSASNPDAFYVGRGYLAKGGEKVIENIDENGTYPNVTVGNATKATTADTATRANTAATAATAVNISDAPVLTATEDEQITVKVGNKTSNALTVPYAQRADFATDLSGRVEATPEVFTYRPSAGDKSIKDDNAFIRRVKGNSVVFNQIVPDVMTIQYGTGSLADHTYTITPTGSYPGIKGTFNKLIPDGHKLFISMGLRIEGVANPRIGINIQGGINTSLYYTQNSTGLTNFEQIITITGATNYNIIFFADASATLITIARPHIIDLTQMFGAGNEPTVEEFRALYPNSYYPYNAGELRNLDCYGIKTVGFNEFNGTYARVLPNESYYLSGSYTSIGFAKELGGATETISIPSNRIYTPTQLGYIYATGTDICINLHHTGYRDGEYEPYKEVTHALPLSQITNGEPLRKAGSVYDEINETEYIRRVGVVDLGSYDWYETPNGTFYTVVNIPDIKAVELESNYMCVKYIGISNPSDIYAGTADNLTISTNAAGRIYIRDDAYKTGTAYAAVPALKASLSGVLLQYELAEPIVTPIETPIDLNYYVEDFGTEEAILAENSAPFSADIIYQFNATDQVRNNSRNIQRLQKSVFTPSGTTAQYIRGDGSYADVSELASVIPINDGEKDSPEESEYNLEIRLFPQQYAKPAITLDEDNNPRVLIRMEAPDNTGFVAEYWLELEIGESIPEIQFGEPDDDSVLFRINGDILEHAVNIIHIITTDGGMRYFGEIKSYLTE